MKLSEMLTVKIFQHAYLSFQVHDTAFFNWQ